VSAPTTDFGFEEVPLAEKARRVAGVFSAVAGQYDVMNDLMSFGLHRLWKRVAIELCQLRPGQKVLDLAGGTGDLTRLAKARVGDAGTVVLSDINAAMLARGRDKLLDAGLAQGVPVVRADAQWLPFRDDSFDCALIGFGLRNVTDKSQALAAMQAALKPGGRAVVLEFSTPVVEALKPVYDAYSFQVLPRLGQWVAGDAASYRYLAESIRKHPDQETLKGMMEAAGLARCQYFNLAGGIVAIHRGFKT
jgi:demethylmenaquinone methyltransferase/2-methoxy-6-polyprenyl-1,4-benzoquinol methylase